MTAAELDRSSTIQLRASERRLPDDVKNRRLTNSLIEWFQPVYRVLENNTYCGIDIGPNFPMDKFKDAAVKSVARGGLAKFIKMPLSTQNPAKATAAEEKLVERLVSFGRDCERNEESGLVVALGTSVVTLSGTERYWNEHFVRGQVKLWLAFPEAPTRHLILDSNGSLAPNVHVAKEWDSAAAPFGSYTARHLPAELIAPTYDEHRVGY